MSSPPRHLGDKWCPTPVKQASSLPKPRSRLDYYLQGGGSSSSPGGSKCLAEAEESWAQCSAAIAKSKVSPPWFLADPALAEAWPSIGPRPPRRRLPAVGVISKRISSVLGWPSPSARSPPSQRGAEEDGGDRRALGPRVRCRDQGGMPRRLEWLVGQCATQQKKSLHLQVQ